MAQKYGISLYSEFDECDTPDTKYIVVTDGVLPVATCRLHPENGKVITLGRIVVLPEYRGRGLGRQTVHAAELWARELGYTTAFIEARENKVGFYEKLGYIPDFSKLKVGKIFTCVHMEKDL